MMHAVVLGDIGCRETMTCVHVLVHDSIWIRNVLQAKRVPNFMGQHIDGNRVVIVDEAHVNVDTVRPATSNATA